ncbi:RNA polymerase alpha subunit [Gossypium australe]|uniref:RNA polymerase alpha subunit n=1 Tax=Gossypium australe TaxID=47621 RepID=A0A5B6VKT6_9ROSI|nr:RNA polymerase alpha subunit [Gossypium australe]
MVREKTRTRNWKCVESSTGSKPLYYGRFILSPLMKGQAGIIGIAMRRALQNLRNTTRIFYHSKNCIERELYGTRNTFICAKGPEYVTAQDIILRPSMEIIDNTQHVASLTEPIDLCIGLQIERNGGYGIKTPKNFHDGSYPINVVFMPVRNVNHGIHCYGNDNKKHEILFLEI